MEEKVKKKKTVKFCSRFVRRKAFFSLSTFLASVLSLLSLAGLILSGVCRLLSTRKRLPLFCSLREDYWARERFDQKTSSN